MMFLAESSTSIWISIISLAISLSTLGFTVYVWFHANSARQSAKEMNDLTVASLKQQKKQDVAAALELSVSVGAREDGL